jgi:hypothetical protein
LKNEWLRLRYLLQKTGRLKPRLYKQNLPPQVEEGMVKMTLPSSEDRAVETAPIQTKPAFAG